MPDDLAEARELYLTAVANSVTADDAADAAEDEAAQARNRAADLREAQAAAFRSEREAHDRFVAALRAHGYKDTASGPVPVVRGRLLTETGQPATVADVISSDLL